MKRRIIIITYTLIKMKFNDEQKEVLALLPSNVKESNELTDAAKIILANLMLWSGTEHAMSEGYMYRTNKSMMEDTGIKSEKTIIAAVNKLIEFGFIERKAGQRKSASEYRLNTVKINGYTVKIDCKNTVENYSNKLQYKEKNYSNKLQYKEKNYSNKLQYNNEDIVLIVNRLQSTVKELQSKITVLENEILQYKNYSIKNYSENKNYSTDTESDTEIELEKELKNNNNNDNFSIDQDQNEILSLNENNSSLDSSKNEMEISIFDNPLISDENDEIENNSNTVKFIDGKFTVVSETEDEINSSSDVEQDNETLNTSNSNITMENEILNSSTAVEDKNKLISNSDNSKDNEISNDFQFWGKIQPLYEKTSNRMIEYLFTQYENLNDVKNVSNGYHQVKQYISLDKEQLNISIPSTGTFGILSYKDGNYNFIECDSNPYNGENNNLKRSLQSEKKGGEAAAVATASNNVDTTVKTSQVYRYTTKTEITAPVQSANSNTEDMCYMMYGVTSNELNDIMNNHSSYNNKGAWRNMTINFHGKQTTITETLNSFKEKKKDGKEFNDCNTFLYHFTNICNEVEKLHNDGTMTDEQYQDFVTILCKVTKGKFAYWHKVFTTRAPRPNFPSEKEMWLLLGCPQITNPQKPTDNVDTTVKTSQVDNYTTKTEITAPAQSQNANTETCEIVVLPSLRDLYKMDYDEAIKTLEKFVTDNPNISREQKNEFNNNISSAFGVQLYNID